MSSSFIVYDYVSYVNTNLLSSPGSTRPIYEEQYTWTTKMLYKEYEDSFVAQECHWIGNIGTAFNECMDEYLYSV